MWGGGIFAPAVTVWFRTLESIKMRNTLVQTATRVGLDQFVFAPCVLSGMFLFLDCGSCGISEMCTVSRCAGWGRRMLDGSLERLWSSVFFLARGMDGGGCWTRKSLTAARWAEEEDVQ